MGSRSLPVPHRNISRTAIRDGFNVFKQTCHHEPKLAMLTFSNRHANLGRRHDGRHRGRDTPSMPALQRIDLRRQDLVLLNHVRRRGPLSRQKRTSQVSALED